MYREGLHTYLLVGLLENLEELPHDVLVLALAEQRGGDTQVAGATGTADLVHVLVNVRGEIEVDDVPVVGGRG